MTQTPNLAIEHIAAGQNQKEVTANAAFDFLGRVVTDLRSVDLAGGDATLTADQFRRHVYVRGSGHGVARVLTVQAVRRLFPVENAGSDLLTVRRGGTDLVLAAGARQLFYADGTTNGLTPAGAAGEARLRINGTTLIDETGISTQNTGNAGVNGLPFELQRTNAVGDNVEIDDVYLTTGALLGDSRVYVLAPSADAAQKDFTPDSGSDNSARANQLPTDSDTSYVEAGTVGEKDLYELEDLPLSPANIRAVQTVTEARKTDAGSVHLRAVLRSGATEAAAGDPVSLGDGYQHHLAVFEEDPDTSAAWTKEALDALQVGQEVVSGE